MVSMPSIFFIWDSKTVVVSVLDRQEKFPRVSVGEVKLPVSDQLMQL